MRPLPPPTGFTRLECALLWLASLSLLAAAVLLGCWAIALQHSH